MTDKNKKIIATVSLVGLALFILVSFLVQPSVKEAIFELTVPLLPSQPTPQITAIPIPPAVSPIVPRQTNVDTITSKGDSAKSLIERNKISPDLPIRVDNFETSLKQKTTINIFTLPSDPKSIIHIEIYGVNYNHPETNQSDALAFKESFLLAKKALTTRGVNIRSLQITFGNRQYIQDTATYWVETFKLMD
jgi:hypothetical protein